ncbi:xanthine dehydrogenase molybdopterin binding subunit [Notoacmeibacter sp. MSK16QG-6]|uniref:xanthine dehydrogenase molybdopterin binding subunit n=1 Tax=Notoacmeibacter sp. MSK16QG-6 TaxID=2957982 RepID=UPI00209EC784|nr:xanthine dehydrogenase molybdopterin binding subunit [Notoacmeibacter sp. MSK16QG-6]MCP1199776.1 xanthine dehydrogenase molybdopterin binding subunit [Notoacmeibacter sp. MSK16QG-6]
MNEVLARGADRKHDDDARSEAGAAYADAHENAPAHQSKRHDSAHLHVAGRAPYTDDLPEPPGTLHAYLGLSSIAHGRIATMDLAEVGKQSGVVAVITGHDLTHNDASAWQIGDEPFLTTEKVEFLGQPVFLVVATSRNAARRACQHANIEYVEETPILDVDQARKAGGRTVIDGMTLSRGDADRAIADAPRQLSGSMLIGGQDHFYLEGQVAFAIPGEDGTMTVHSSTQHPSETQMLVAHTLHRPAAMVTVEVRRMGGAFGGKESQANLFAALAAFAADRLGTPVKIRPDRDDDMVATGKRHDFRADYEVGFDDDGRIHGVKFKYAARCGFSADLSGPVTDRALFHCDNAYYWPAVQAVSEPLFTNTVSNTAFRGFGGPQGMVGAERVIDEVTYATGLDPIEVRRRNFYGEDERSLTPYYQEIEDFVLPRIWEELLQSSGYEARRETIRQNNREAKGFMRRGIALTPVKFGISFTATHLNQAGALVHVYTDGSIHLNHGGTEMGQGLNTKVAQVVAAVFGVALDQIRITATSTGKVPNTSATAASSGADLNGMAAKLAAETIRQRLVDYAVSEHGVPAEQVVFRDGRVQIGNREIGFQELVEEAYTARIQLSATGYYRTPKIHWDRTSGRGHPFYYFAYGAAVAEVEIDTLTGEYTVEQVDILHETGNSLNPAIDIGQIEGGFIQGMGWLTTEELVWDQTGRLRTHAPSTYKIPLASDIPREFNVRLAEWSRAHEPTVFRSKAVGEPPFMLAMSVLHALSDAVASVADYKICPRLDPPATPERVLMTIERLRAEAAAAD